MKIHFPNLGDVDLVLGAPELVANPKAVAAQVYKAKGLNVIYRDSKVWEDLGPLMFKSQFPLQSKPPVLEPIDGDDWIQFPYVVRDWFLWKCCAVWLEGDDCKVRHVRIYPTQDMAEHDNCIIEDILKEPPLV